MQNKEKKRKETCSTKTQKQTNDHKINAKKRESAVAIFPTAKLYAIFVCIPIFKLTVRVYFLFQIKIHFFLCNKSKHTLLTTEKKTVQLAPCPCQEYREDKSTDRPVRVKAFPFRSVPFHCPPASHRAVPFPSSLAEAAAARCFTLLAPTTTTTSTSPSASHQPPLPRAAASGSRPPSSGEASAPSHMPRRR
jgi:hypothetical protein